MWEAEPLAASEERHAVSAARRRVAWVLGSCFSVQGVICRLCERSCAEDAIHLIALCGGYARPQVDEDRCTGCGDCVTACPGAALEMWDTER